MGSTISPFYISQQRSMNGPTFANTRHILHIRSIRSENTCSLSCLNNEFRCTSTQAASTVLHRTSRRYCSSKPVVAEISTTISSSFVQLCPLYNKPFILGKCKNRQNVATKFLIFSSKYRSVGTVHTIAACKPI